MYRSNGLLIGGVLLAALGAVLRFAISESEIFSIDLATVGLILILVGIVLAVIAIVQMLAGGRRETIVRDETGRERRETFYDR